jgi:hypothetical protein
MSFGTVFFLASVIGAYKLGFLMCKDPDAISKWLKLLWSWMNK